MAKRSTLKIYPSSTELGLKQKYNKTNLRIIAKQIQMYLYLEIFPINTVQKKTRCHLKWQMGAEVWSLWFVQQEISHFCIRLCQNQIISKDMSFCSDISVKLFQNPLVSFIQTQLLSWFWLIVLVFSDMSTLVGCFVSSPREREKRGRRDSKRDKTRGPWWPCNAHLSNIALWEPDLELIKPNILIKVQNDYINK